MSSLATIPKRFCFVLMPFSEEFQDVYELGIRGACTDAGLYCERVDEQHYVGSIVERIYHEISKADLLVADMTGRNANVFYEVGYAHALGKLVVPITQTVADIPFDLRNYPHIVYGKQITKLRSQLTARLTHLLSQQVELAATRIELQLFAGHEPITEQGVELQRTSPSTLQATLTLHNASAYKVYSGSDYRVSIIAPPQLNDNPNIRVPAIPLPDGRILHRIPEAAAIFPNDYLPIQFQLAQKSPIELPPSVEILVRISTAAGYLDFPVRFVADA